MSIFLSLLPVSHIFGGGELVQKFKAEPAADLFVVDIMMKQATAIFRAVEK